MKQREIDKIIAQGKKLLNIDVRDLYKQIDLHVTKWIKILKDK